MADPMNVCRRSQKVLKDKLGAIEYALRMGQSLSASLLCEFALPVIVILWFALTCDKCTLTARFRKAVPPESVLRNED